MLGCQDFCGYYDWTFHFVRRRFGQQAVGELWHHAIGMDSQLHYLTAGQSHGLRGLYHAWVKTGEEEHCDWTFTLDEQKNVLRWDMRRCPSKGFLMQNDLNADEDYCDHCIGWIAPMLEKIGCEAVEHEHNHHGQCWCEIRVKGKPYTTLDLPADVRKTPDWNRGYLDRWENNQKRPLSQTISDSADPAEVLIAWSRGGGAVVTDAAYLAGAGPPDRPLAVLVSTPPVDLSGLAERYLATPETRRPLLLGTYLPGQPFADYVSFGLPRPLPILPLLIRQGLYVHHPGEPAPTADRFVELLARALSLNEVNHAR